MKESFPHPKPKAISETAPADTERAAYSTLAERLSQRTEAFAFTGINPEHYAELKAADEEAPGWTTPIDVLVERFNAEGVKVVFGKNPGSGNIFVLPMGSDNIEEDSLKPRHLAITDDMDDELRELIIGDVK